MAGEDAPLQMDASDATDVTDVSVLLERWVERGLITGEQAARIRVAEGIDRDVVAGTPTGKPADGPPGGPSLLAEGLGYVGGALVVVAAVIIAGRFWTELGMVGRLGAVSAAGLLLLGAGAAAPAVPGSTGQRLRAVSWLLAVVAVSGAVGLFGDEVLDLAGETTLLVAAAVSALLAAALWSRCPTPVQQVAFFVAAVVTAGAATALLPDGDEHAVGLAAWGCGVVWLLLGWGGVVRGRATADVCGGVAAAGGALLTVGSDAGSVLAVLTAAALVVAGVLTADLVLLGVGSLATLVTVPVVIGRLFPDVLAAALALLGAGALLVVGGLVTARRRAGSPGRGATGTSAPHPRTAISAAAVLAVAAVVAVIVVGR